MGLFAAAVFMLGVLPILLKAKEDQVYLYLTVISIILLSRIVNIVEFQNLSRRCDHIMLFNYHIDGIIDDESRDDNDDHRRIFR